MALLTVLGASGCDASNAGMLPPGDKNPADPTKGDDPAGGGGAPGGGPTGDPSSDGGGLAKTDGGTTGPTGFVHPGVLVDQAQLVFGKAKIAAGAEPWKSAYANAKNSAAGSLTYQAHPVAVVQCGPFSMPDVGCTAEKSDAGAAYTHALLWYYGGDPAHAKKAIEIMDAWSEMITSHTLSNAPLQLAWVASVFPRAGEIIRYTYTGWDPTKLARFEGMLKNVYLPEVVKGSSSNGNWELSMIEATIDIGVFLDDRASFETAVSLWKKRTPAYAYLSSDGADPVSPTTGGTKSASALKGYWYNPTSYVDGLSQETCRDLGHVQYGFAAMFNAAETARIQGVDLYSLEQKRLTTTMEFHAAYLAGITPNSNARCGVAINAVSPDPMWEIAYNEYATRLGISLPNTEKLIAKIRPTYADHHMQWETLTHALTGSVGIP